MKMLKLFAFLFVLLTPFVALAQTGISTAAKQAIVIDFDTGAVLFEKNADERMPTSSMSKTMTMYELFRRLKSGEMSLTQTLSVSEKAWQMQGSKMFVDIGSSIPVEDLIRGVIIQSGNDATVVLAEGMEGSEEAFAYTMNERAKELGMTNSHFMNASGWPDPEHYSTARDLATLGRALIHDFPEYYKYYSEKEFTYNNIKQGNRNPLLYRNLGADGIKTGHTEEGGFGLMGSGQRDGRRVVFVVNGLPDMNARADESANILDWGLRSFENVNVIKSGESYGTAPVLLGKVKQVSAIAQDDVLTTVLRGKATDIQVTFTPQEKLTAPITKGQAIGTLSAAMPDGKTVEAPAVAGEDVEQLNIFLRSIEKIKLFFLNLFGKA